jgi:hypothetical protein
MNSGEGRLGRSWRLTKTAFALIEEDSALQWLAAASALTTIAAMVAIFDLGGYFTNPLHSQGHLALIVLIAYWPLTFVATFFSVAVAAAAAARLEGGHLTLRQALAAASGRLRDILLWSLLATGVGILLREIAERIPGGGRVAAWLLGIAWGLTTTFVVPVIALEGCSAPRCAKRSATLIKETWGESVGGNVAVTAIFTVVTIPAAMLLGFGAAELTTNRTAGLVLLSIGLVLLMLVSSIAGTVRQVFATALYRYAVAPEASGWFAEDDLRHPFTKGGAPGATPSGRSSWPSKNPDDYR